jgi:hypothetical protein
MPTTPDSPDEVILNDPDNELHDGLSYYRAATRYLIARLSQRRATRESPCTIEAKRLLQFWDQDSWRDDMAAARDNAIGTQNLGIAGKALWYLRGDTSVQLSTELERFAQKPEIRGTHYLFYMVGTLAAHDFRVSLVEEKGDDHTPDIFAAKDSRAIWIEATTKQPRIRLTSAQEIETRIREIFDDKLKKFHDHSFWPGMIVADIINMDVDANERNTPPRISMHSELSVPLPHGTPRSSLYRTYADPDWHQRNGGNIVAYLIDHMSYVDRTITQIDQLLLTIREVEVHENHISFPEQHLLIVHRDAEQTALGELATQAYAFESRQIV